MSEQRQAESQGCMGILRGAWRLYFWSYVIVAIVVLGAMIYCGYVGTHIGGG